MSQLEGNSVQINSSTSELEKFEVTGWEIVPYVPKKQEETGNFSKDQQAELRARLSKLLKKIVTETVSQVKSRLISPDHGSTTTGTRGSSRTNKKDSSTTVKDAMPVAFKVPEDCVVNPIRLHHMFLSQQSSAQTIKLRNATSLEGEVSFSFKLPNDFLGHGVDVDKLPVPEDKRTISRRFSFSERLQGWKIERRKRINGRYDLYYRHEESRTLLRSNVEVVNFLLYEENPYKNKNKRNKSSVEGYKRTRTWQKRKSTCNYVSADDNINNVDDHNIYSDHQQEIKIKRRMVENFLADACKNFLNAAAASNFVSHEQIDTINNHHDHLHNQDDYDYDYDYDDDDNHTDNSSEATQENLPTQTAQQFFDTSSQKHCFPKDDIKRNKIIDDEKPNDDDHEGEESTSTDTEATCSDPMIIMSTSSANKNVFMEDYNGHKKDDDHHHEKGKKLVKVDDQAKMINVAKVGNDEEVNSPATVKVDDNQAIMIIKSMKNEAINNITSTPSEVEALMKKAKDAGDLMEAASSSIINRSSTTTGLWPSERRRRIFLPNNKVDPS